MNTLCLHFFLHALGTLFANQKKNIRKAGICNRFILETSLVFLLRLGFIFISGCSVQCFCRCLLAKFYECLKSSPSIFFKLSSVFQILTFFYKLLRFSIYHSTGGSKCFILLYALDTLTEGKDIFSKDPQSWEKSDKET